MVWTVPYLIGFRYSHEGFRFPGGKPASRADISAERRYVGRHHSPLGRTWPFTSRTGLLSLLPQ